MTLGSVDGAQSIRVIRKCLFITRVSNRVNASSAVLRRDWNQWAEMTSPNKSVGGANYSFNSTISLCVGVWDGGNLFLNGVELLCIFLYIFLLMVGRNGQNVGEKSPNKG